MCGMPYWQMLVEMMPILSCQRGSGSACQGVLRDDLRVCQHHAPLRRISVHVLEDEGDRGLGDSQKH